MRAREAAVEGRLVVLMVVVACSLAVSFLFWLADFLMVAAMMGPEVAWAAEMAGDAGAAGTVVVLPGVFSTPASVVLVSLAPLGARSRPRLLFFFLLAMVMVSSEDRGGAAEEAACEEEDWGKGEEGGEGDRKPEVPKFTSVCCLNVRANQNRTNSISNQCALTSAALLCGPLVRATSPLSSNPSTVWVHRLFARLHVAQALRARPVRGRPANSTNDMFISS